MVKYIIDIFIALLFSIVLLLSCFELTLLLFHSPIGTTIVEPHAHTSTWIYLLKQQYISLIDIELFNIHEKRHLLDVKRLFEMIYNIWVYLLLTALFTLIILSIRAKERLFIILKMTTTVGFLFNIVLILIAFNFLENFQWLHQLLFLKSSWIFPKDSILMAWFPLLYFKQFFLMILLLSSSLLIFSRLAINRSQPNLSTLG